MEIYIEYAFLENFLFDGVLLVLALDASRTEIRRKRVLIASVLGGVFALAFPLLVLPPICIWILKVSVGALLCLTAHPPIRTKKDRGRYAMTLAFFYAFTFGFGGALLSLSSDRYERVPTVVVMLGFAALVCGSCFLIRILHKKRRIYPFLRDCILYCGEKRIREQGFVDSGNLARKNGLPVCFVSPDLFYDLFETYSLHTDSGQVCDEIQIQTLGGVKKLPTIQGEIEILHGGKRRRQRVYFSRTQNIVRREYRILLSVDCLEEKE